MLTSLRFVVMEITYDNDVPSNPTVEIWNGDDLRIWRDINKSCSWLKYPTICEPPKTSIEHILTDRLKRSLPKISKNNSAPSCMFTVHRVLSYHQVARDTLERYQPASFSKEDISLELMLESVTLIDSDRDEESWFLNVLRSYNTALLPECLDLESDDIDFYEKHHINTQITRRRKRCCCH